MQQLEFIGLLYNILKEVLIISASWEVSLMVVKIQKKCGSNRNIFYLKLQLDRS